MLDMKGRKIIYITGCGRSGSTLLGFALGNTSSALDLGEVNDFARLDGKPNGFPEGTDNFNFWASVTSRIRERNGFPAGGFPEVRRLQKSVDYHRFMYEKLVFGRHWRTEDVCRYESFLTALYQSVLDSVDADILIDSSKYPSRLWHLNRIVPHGSLYIVHLRRARDAVIRSMQSPGQGTKSWLSANVYFYAIEFLVSRLFKLDLSSRPTFFLSYEKLIANPERELLDLTTTFGIDGRGMIQKIRSGEPLKRGFIFNGNRMRMQPEVIFRRRREN